MNKDRRKDRYEYERPDSVYVRCTIEKESEGNRERILTVINSSKTGLALLITDKDFDLLHMVKKGDVIRDMTFFGGRVKIKQDGIVRHITKIKGGEHKGCYSLGMYAPDIAE